MEFRTLGASGIVVTDLALGAMNFGMPGGTANDQAIKMIHRALDEAIADKRLRRQSQEE